MSEKQKRSKQAEDDTPDITPIIRRAIMLRDDFPTIVCLCGSTRFGDTYRREMLRETLAGRIVLTVGATTQSDQELLAEGTITGDVKVALDVLHKQKIYVADEVLILNVGGYIGESTASEIEYAQSLRKVIRYLEPITEEMTAG